MFIFFFPFGSLSNAVTSISKGLGLSSSPSSALAHQYASCPFPAPTSKTDGYFPSFQDIDIFDLKN